MKIENNAAAYEKLIDRRRSLNSVKNTKSLSSTMATSNHCNLLYAASTPSSPPSLDPIKSSSSGPPSPYEFVALPPPNSKACLLCINPTVPLIAVEPLHDSGWLIMLNTYKQQRSSAVYFTNASNLAGCDSLVSD
jgi:hypothetical protein